MTPRTIVRRASNKGEPVQVLIVNAGLAGAAGNSQVVAEHCSKLLARQQLSHELLVLRDATPLQVQSAMRSAQSFVFVTGTYWGSCSSLLQALLEQLTPMEGTDFWLGKPAAVLVSAHQVGAQTVLWRLQGVLSSLGCLIPPMSGAVVTRVGEALRARAPEVCNDVWGLDDVAVTLGNLEACLAKSRRYQAWQVDSSDYRARWLESQ